MLQKPFGLLLLIVSLAGCGRENGPAKATTAEKPAASTETSAPDTPPAQTPSPNATTAEASSQVAKYKDKAPPAAPKPTVWRASELAKVLDCGALPTLEGTKAGSKNAASLTAMVPGKIPDIAKFYLTNLAALGWQPEENLVSNAINEEHASMTLVKDGHFAYLSISKVGTLPEAHVRLLNHGNLDTRTLPHREDPANFGRQTTSHYYSAKSVDEEADWLEKSLAADGWQKFERFASSASAIGNFRIWDLRKQGYALDVFISSAKAQGNKTSVQYSVIALGHELPSPPEATNVKFEDDAWKMRCEAPGDVKTVGEFYQKAMPAAGYKPLPSEEPRDTYWNLRFGTETDDIVLVQVSSKDGKTVKVNLSGLSAELLAEMKRQDEIKAANLAKKQPPKETPVPALKLAPPEPELFVKDVPLPKGAKTVKYLEKKKEITFEVAGGMESVAVQLREQLLAAGWKEDKTFAIVNKLFQSLTFKKGSAALDISLRNASRGAATQATITARGLNWRKTEP